LGKASNSLHSVFNADRRQLTVVRLTVVRLTVMRLGPPQRVIASRERTPKLLEEDVKRKACRFLIKKKQDEALIYVIMGLLSSKTEQLMSLAHQTRSVSCKLF
jgi:hypothetical protein